MLARMADRVNRLNDIVRKTTAEPKAGAFSGSSRLLAELERERSRIARELHAGAGQPLAALRMNLELLDEWAAAMPQPAKDTVSRLRNLSESALEQIRAVSHRLHPPEWQHLTTEQAVRGLIEQTGLAGWFETTIQIGPLPIEPGYATKIAVYRCAQECIANVIRHSQATHIKVVLAAAGDSIELTVADNGKGIDPVKTSGGIGLDAIREHIVLLDGQLQVASGEQGTTITISFPLGED